MSTGDAAPLAEPYRISDEPTKDDAAVVIGFHQDGLWPSEGLVPGDAADGSGPVPEQDSLPLVGYLIRVGGVSVDTGTYVEQRTSVCWDGAVCDSDYAVESDFVVPDGETVQADVLYSELGALADGSYTMNVYAAIDLDQGD